MSQLEDLLQQCTVKLSLPGQIGWGTGFFVGPELILTCAHVVRAAKEQAVKVRWQRRELEAVAEQSLPDPYDLALLRVALPASANPPCVYLGEEIFSRDPLYLFGYPDQDFPNGCPVTFNCEGLTGDAPTLIKFTLGQVRPGMSGAPLLNQRTGKVCGIVKFTRDRSIDLGGGAIPTYAIVEQFPQLQELQRKFHENDRRWSDLVTKQPKVDFQLYLNAITTSYEKWWELYTLTDVEGNQQQSKDALPIFDFGLMVQTLKEEREQQQERVERFTVLEGIRKYADQHVLLVGRPGSGKSTALARFLLEEATLHQAKIPVLVELRYWRGSITKLILNAFAQHGLPLTEEQLEMVLSQSLILFDGVNELPSEESRLQLSAFRRNYPKVPMIFTTRNLSLGGDLGIEKKLEMQPLTEAQMQSFIRAYVPEQAEEMLRQLRDRLREFGQTPLLLWMLCEVFQQTSDNQLPSNLAGVFRAFTVSYEISSIRKHEVALLKGDVRPLSDRRLWSKALKALASVMMQGETPVDFRVVIQRDEAERELSRIFSNEQFPVRDILDDLLKYHLLQNCSTDQIEFRHQLIQDYYAAEYLLQLLPGSSDEHLKRDFLNYLKWTEPVLLMVALADQETQVLSIVKSALEIDLALGAKLAGAVRPKFQAQTINLITESAIPKLLKIQLLGLTHSIHALADLHEYLAAQDLNVRLCATEALGKISNELSIYPLHQALIDEDSDVRFNAAKALGRIGSEEALSILREALQDEDFNTRLTAANPLAEIEDEAAVSEFVRALTHGDPDVRSQATDNLLSIDNQKIKVSILLQVIKLSNSDISYNATESFLFQSLKDDSDACSDTVKTLLHMNSKASVSALYRELENEDFNIRYIVATELGKVGSTAGISVLCKLLENESIIPPLKVIEEVNEIAFLSPLELPSYKKIFQELGYSQKCGGELVSPVLLQGLKRKEYHIRINSLLQLGSLATYEKLVGREFMIPVICSALEDEDVDICIHAASVLKNIASQITSSAICQALEGAIPFLYRALEHENPEISYGAATALNQISSQASIFTLQDALISKDPIVRFCAASILKKDENETEISQLIQNLENKDSRLRRQIANVLMISTDDSEIENSVLTRILDDQDWEVRCYGAIALGRRGFDSVLPILRQALENGSTYIRRRAIWALERISREDAVSLLVFAASHDDDRLVCENAQLYALRGIDNEPEITTLIQNQRDKDPELCVSALYACGLIRSQAAISALIKAAKSNDSLICLHAVIALGRTESESVISALKEALENKNSFVRFYAVNALSNIEGSTAFHALCEALEHEDDNVSSSAVRKLGEIGDGDAISALCRVLTEDTRISIRRSAASALKNSSDESAVRVLVQALQDADYSVRIAAAQSLREIGGEEAVSALAEALKHENLDVRQSISTGLFLFGSNESAIAALYRALDCEDSSIRINAAFALDAIFTGWQVSSSVYSVDQDALISAFIKIIEDKNPQVAVKAVPALGEMGNFHLLPRFSELLLATADTRAFDTLSLVQSRCKFYNYEIAQALIP
ncbi:HEAT repeat domain-containing protein [Phormidium tenue FACHB-886]|nr:HEAT repeat domain-containing protein [Phormidium tenue FACHB-886]